MTFHFKLYLLENVCHSMFTQCKTYKVKTQIKNWTMIWRYVDMIKLLKVLWGYDLMIKKKIIHVIWTQVNQIWMINYVMHWFSPTIQEKIRDRVIISSYPPCQITLSLCMCLSWNNRCWDTTQSMNQVGREINSNLRWRCFAQNLPHVYSPRESHMSSPIGF